MKVLRVALLSALLVTGCGPAVPNTEVRADPQRPTVPPAFLADLTSSVLTSSVSKRAYQISVALPDGYAKDHPAYPVLYAADANAEFGTVVETARLLSYSKQIPDLVIIGIGYANVGQGFKASRAPRTLDLTPTEDQAWVKEFAKQSEGSGVPPPEASGGAAAFLSFVRDELIPSIEQRYNVSHDDRAWYGHSFGGLFGLYLLFHGDGLFQRFIVGSPSIWWNNRAIFASEASFAAAAKPLAARVFFSVGALEQGPAPIYPMVTDLRTFVERLKRRNYRGLVFGTQVFEGENHLSVVPATVSKGLRFVYPTAPNPALQPSAPAKTKRRG